MKYLTLIPASSTFTVVMGMEDIDTQISEVDHTQACVTADADNYCLNHVDVWTSIYWKGFEVDYVLMDGKCVGFVQNDTRMPFEYKTDSDGSHYDDYPEAMSAHVQQYMSYQYMKECVGEDVYFGSESI